MRNMMKSGSVQIKERGRVARNTAMTGCAIVGGYIAILVMGNWLRNGKWRGTITMRGVLRHVEIIHFTFLEVAVTVAVIVEVGHGVATVV